MNRRKLMGWLLCGLLAPVRLFKGRGRSEVSEQGQGRSEPLRDEKGRFKGVDKPVVWRNYTFTYKTPYGSIKDELKKHTE